MLMATNQDRVSHPRLPIHLWSRWHCLSAVVNSVVFRSRVHFVVTVVVIPVFVVVFCPETNIMEYRLDGIEKYFVDQRRIANGFEMWTSTPLLKQHGELL